MQNCPFELSILNLYQKEWKLLENEFCQNVNLPKNSQVKPILISL